MVVHGHFFSLELFVQVFFRLIHLMGRGVGWSLADVQFVRDGAGGANLSLLARSRGWSYSSLEKLVRRTKHGESGTRKPRASRVLAKMFRFGESGLSAQNCRVHTKVSRKRDLKPSMALEGDKLMKGIMVAAVGSGAAFRAFH